jgi:hypothetical protein
MAKRLKSFPKVVGGRRPKYPWDEWTDGSIWELRGGQDFEVAAYAMQAMLHGKARKLGLTVKTRSYESEQGDEILVFQFQKPPR